MRIEVTLSRILSPWLMPSYLMLLFFFKKMTMQDIFVAVFFFSFIPTLALYLSYKITHKDKIDVYKRERRHVFYLIGLLSFLTATLFLMNSNFQIFLIVLSYFTLMLCVTIINFFFKISFHAASASNFATILLWSFGPFAIFSYSLLVLIYAIRLKMKIHSIRQLLVGTLLPLITTSLIFLIVK